MRCARTVIAHGSLPSRLSASMNTSAWAETGGVVAPRALQAGLDDCCDKASADGTVSARHQEAGLPSTSCDNYHPGCASQRAVAAFSSRLPVGSAVGGLVRPWVLQNARGFAASALGSRSGGPDAAEEVVDATTAAKRVLEDPMSRILASQGMPVGLSLGAVKGAGPGPGSSGGGSGGPGGDGSGEEEDPSRPPRAEPGYQMEAFQDMLRATAAAARRGGQAGASSSGSESGGSDAAESVFTAGVQHVGPSLEDSWGTTRESPADIARRIAESNMDAELAPGTSGLPGDAADDGHDDDDGDAPMTLSPSEEKYASLEAMSRDIKRLDEVFEVLASVPWLDDDVLAEKELKGVARVGLLGTLEEVGFNIRPQLLRIWSGERGAELAAGPGLEFRDQAALMAILYHTHQIEGEHGHPPRGYLAAPQQDQQSELQHEERQK